MTESSRIQDWYNPALDVLASQPSHRLFVLANARGQQDAAFRGWLAETGSRELSGLPGMVRARHYRLHDVDITRGRRERLPFRFLTICDLSLDGAEQAEPVIEAIEALHAGCGIAEAPACWLTFAVGEKVGRSTPDASMLTIAFANGVAGDEEAFREFYITRHVRHALNIPALVSGQCFQRTHHQRPGSMPARFSLIAVYEQIAGPEQIVEAIERIPAETFRFPTLDTARFSEAVYERIPTIAEQ